MSTLPGWLDPAAEVPLPPHAPRDDADWTCRLLAVLGAIGVPTPQRYEAAGIAACETGWYDSSLVALHNWGGSKAKQDVVEHYRERTGRPMRWCRAPGHASSGDPPEVYYAAWDDDAGYWRDWLTRHVGFQTGVMPRATIYRDASLRFWAGDPAWIRSLIAAGYRGNTSAEPKLSRAVDEHQAIVRRVRVLVAQSRLGVRTDGDWGPKSRAALAVIQHAHGRLETGDLDDASLALLETR